MGLFNWWKTEEVVPEWFRFCDFGWDVVEKDDFKIADMRVVNGEEHFRVTEEFMLHDYPYCYRDRVHFCRVSNNYRTKDDLVEDLVSMAKFKKAYKMHYYGLQLLISFN